MRTFTSAALLISSLAVAQTRSTSPAHPNLSGTWNLNSAASDFGQAPPPLRQTEEITQAGEEFANTINLERTEMKQHYTLRFRIGDPPISLAAGSFPDDAPFRIVTVHGEWQGRTLVLTEKISYLGSDGTLTARYTLAANGKSLDKESHVSMSAGEFDTKTVYDKQ
jgi:hypothetical protein